MSITYTGSVTVTTTGNIDDLDFSNKAIILMNNASLATIRGLKAGTPGQLVTIYSIGAGEVDFAHQNAGSSAANRLINNVTSGITPIAPGVGKASYQYDGVTSRWRLKDHWQGATINIPYSGGNFVGSGAMTWTVESGDQVAFFYILVNNILILYFTLNGTSVGGTPDTELRATLPNSYTCSSLGNSTLAAIRSYDNGSDTVGFSGAVASATYVRFWRGGFTSWALSTNNTSVQGVAQLALN